MNTVLLAASFLLATALIAQYVYMLFFFTAFPRNKVSKPVSELANISIVVCARNELINLKENLTTLLNQKYPKFEIVVVNDRSWDESESFLESLAKQFSNLRVVNLRDADSFWIGKKFALTIGIKAAKFPYVLLTDADCYPQSPFWCQIMAEGLETNKLVLGYGGILNIGKIGFLSVFETVYSALNWMSWANRGIPYMGVGRNLAYDRNLFLQHKGFSRHMHIPSGDDDLFVSDVANSKNVILCLDKRAFTWSKPPQSFRAWWKQKQRHLSTSTLYAYPIKFGLFVWHFSSVFSYLALPFSVLLWENNQLLAILLWSRWLLLGVFLMVAGIRLSQWKPLILFPILEPFLIVVQAILHIKNLSHKPYDKW